MSTGRVGVVFCVMALVVGCSADEKPGKWPADELPAPYDNTVLNDEVTVASEVLRNCVTVEEDRLVFPANDTTAVVEQWPVGKPVVGGRRTDADEPGNNVFGFVRKVKDIRTEGDQLVVETEAAALSEVFVGDTLQYADFADAEEIELGDVDPDDFFKSPAPAGPEFASGAAAAEGIESPGRSMGKSSRASTGGMTIQQPLGASIDISRDFNLSGEATAVNIDRTLVVNPGQANEATVRLSGDVSIGSTVRFSPRAWLKFDVSAELSWSPIDLYFEAGLQGDLSTTTTTTYDIDVAVISGSQSAVQEGIGTAVPVSGSGLSATLYKGKPMRGPAIAGIPTTFATNSPSTVGTHCAVPCAVIAPWTRG